MTDSSSPSDPRVGSVIQDRYRILAVVASGGMGVVYRAERLQLGRAVAIKFLHPWVASEPSFLQRFDVEARAMSRLAHPNCASVIDFGVDDVPFLVMDFVAGRSLRFILENEHLAPARALAFTRQILAGLAHAHAQGIVHRDLKPENIVVGDAPGLTDHLRILDFGLAKLHDGPPLTVGMAVGTPSYMAPEQTLGEGVVDARTDIYAVGVLLFEMLTGSKPFHSDNIAELILMQQRQPAPPMKALAAGAGLSDAIEAIVARALAKAPGDRFASADEMAAALDKVPENAAMRADAAGEVAQPPPDKAAVASADKTIADARPTRRRAMRLLRPFWKQWQRRQWLLAAASAGAAVMVIAVFVWALGRRDSAGRLALPTPSSAAVPVPAPIDELSPMSPDSTPGLADAAQLVRLGLHDQAVTVLQEIRRNYPHSAYASFLLALAYFDKLWWSVGLQSAQAAMQADPTYRRSPKLAKALIHSLISDSFWEKAAAVLTQDMAEIATPYLEEAAQFDKSPRVRSRAAQLLAGGRVRAPMGVTGAVPRLGRPR